MSVPELNDEFFQEDQDDGFEIEEESTISPRQGTEYGGLIDGKDALIQYLKYMFGVERYSYLDILDGSFGLQTADLVGEERDYVEGELDIRITEMLECDDRILSIDSIEYEYPYKDSMLAKLNINTIYGEIETEQEVLKSAV